MRFNLRGRPRCEHSRTFEHIEGGRGCRCNETVQLFVCFKMAFVCVCAEMWMLVILDLNDASLLASISLPFGRASESFHLIGQKLGRAR